MLPLKKILCPTDFSEPSHEAIQVAGELASHFMSEMVLLHVVPPVSAIPVGTEAPAFTIPPDEQELEASAKRSLAEIVQRLELQGLRARSVLLRGPAADEIVRTAGEEKVDWIVIATRGRTGLDRLLFGSVAEKVVRFAKCPVLTVPGRIPSAPEREAVPEERGEGKGLEKKSANRKAQEEKIEAQLKEWEAKIEELQAQAEKSRAELRRDEEQVEELRAKREALRQKVRDLERSEEEGWEGLKGSMEKGLDELRNTFNRAISKLEEKGAETAEKVSKKREGYVQKIETQLKDWGAKIEVLKAKAEKSKDEVKAKYLPQVEDLRKKQEAVRGKIQEFKGTGDVAWKDLKHGVDQAVDELKRGLKQAVARFREK